MLRTAEEAREISSKREVFNKLKFMMIDGINVGIDNSAKQGWYYTHYDYRKFERDFSFERILCTLVASEIAKELNKLGYEADVTHSNLKIRWG